MKKTITCTTLNNGPVQIPCEKLRFRPAGYGVVIDNGKILLVKVKQSGKYFFPGGEIEIGETIEQAIKRETMEETGLKVKVEDFLYLKESFFYYEPIDDASHSLGIFYKCKPITTDIPKNFEVDDDEMETPQWVELKNLKSDDFQDWGGEILEKLK